MNKELQELWIELSRLIGNYIELTCPKVSSDLDRIKAILEKVDAINDKMDKIIFLDKK